LKSLFRPSIASGVPLAFLFMVLCTVPVSAQPRAVLADGSGPWSDAQWAFAVSQFGGLLKDAGYTVKIVSPVDMAAALDSPDILLAVPSLESLPFDCFTAIVAHVNRGGTLMASGGEPFRDPLYRTPDGRWLDSAAYVQAVGTPPPQGPFTPPPIPTLSPSKEQYTTASGVRVPIARSRGLFSSSYDLSRYRVIGDLLLPSATLYDITSFSFSPNVPPTTAHSLVAWLPWPQIPEPFRGQLVAALKAAPNRLYLSHAGTDQIVWLPGETITGQASILNAAVSPVQATLQWSISGASGVTAQPAVVLNLTAGELRSVPLKIGTLPNGDYMLSFRLMTGNQEVDRVDSPTRVLSPVLSRQPDQKIRVVNGAFSAGGRHVFLRGVNYWPRFTAGTDPGAFNGRSWLDAAQYDPDLIEADLTAIASLHFNLVNIQFSDLQGSWAPEGRALIDFLERCRNHGIWVQISLRTTSTNAAYADQMSPTLESYLQAAYLPGNDRVFAYELLWEPMAGTHDKGGQGRLVNGAIVYNTGRMVLDPDWRAWVNDQYGSLAQAQQAWGFTAPLDATGQLTNPLDDQIQNDGPWRVMVAAYRRFLDDYLGRNLGAIARRIRRSDPDTLLTYRNWTTMTSGHNDNTGYDIGAGAAHLDFLSPERYSPLLWPDNRAGGLITAYSRYRSGGKPVVWAEYGADIGANGGTSVSRAAQAAICDAMMRVVADDGSNGASVWWWPGGPAPLDGTDFGIIDPDGTPRACATKLVQWNTSFSAAPPDLVSDPPSNLTIDRDADARGSYGIFLNNQDRYVQARQTKQSVTLADQGAGADTSTMPLVQAGNVPYDGSGPLKFANAEIASIRVVCPTLDVIVENGTSLTVPPGANCQVTPTLVNTGEAQWLPASAPSRGVILHTSAGDLPLTASLPPLQRISTAPLTVAMGQGSLVLSGRLRISGVGDFGETLNLTLAADSTVSGPCKIALNPAASLTLPSSGATGTIKIDAPTGCAWTAASDQPWTTFNPPAGSGSGAVTYTIDANYGPKRQATIRIGTFAFTVSEDGVSNSPQAQSPALSATSLSFGDRNVGAAGAAQTVQLTNTGSTALSLQAITTGGRNSRDFAETSNCNATLAAGERCTIQVTFTPIAPGIRTASLFIAGNFGGGAPVIDLSGTGIATGPIPAIQAIVDSWGYTAAIAPGLWVTIAGTNLAGPPQTWNLDGVEELPDTLGATTVTFNGAPAPLLYVSPTQINALVPASVAPGKVKVVAQVNGAISNLFTITAQAAQPAVYAPPTADGGTFFVTAALAGTATLVGNSVTDPRVVRPAYPGDTLDLYMIGLGATLDPSKFVTDRVFSGAFPVIAPVTATVGGAPGNVLFAGLTAPGLYLVRIVVPKDLQAGAQPLKVFAGDVQTRPSLVLQMAAPPPQ
jgi:uncharacterized protein (TIGR03437 family)